MRAYVPASWLARALDLQDRPNSGDFLRDSTRLELLVKATPDESNVVLLRDETLERLHRGAGLTCV